MAEDLSIKTSVTGLVETGKQINDAVGKVNQTASGMSTIVQKANQYFQNLTQSKNQQEQKDQQHHRKELERIQKEIEARKALQATGYDVPTAKQQARQDLSFSQQQKGIEALERQKQSIFESQTQAIIPPGAQQPTSRKGIPGVRGAMRMGGAVAGLMGAYSLFSKIGGGMSTIDESQTELAQSMLTLPKKWTAGFDDSIKLFTSDLEILGDTALITTKDMKGMIGALRETGSTSRYTREIQVRIANEAKMMNVDPSISGGIEQTLLRYGGIGSGDDFLQMQRRIGIRGMGTGMSHRMEELLRTQSETMMALSHGANMTGGATIENILGLLDKSGMKMFSGQRGGQLMQRLDQGFRSGGSEIFENFQYLALSPMKQKRVRGKGGFGSGLYDAYAADWIQEQGAFATKEDLIKSARGLGNQDLADYINRTRSGEKTNIELVMSKFKKGLDIGRGGGEDLRFAAEFSGQMGGASMSDIMALNRVFSGKNRERFLKEVTALGFDKKTTAEFASVFDNESEAAKFLKGKRTTVMEFEKIGESLNSVIKENRVVINKALKELSGWVKTGTTAINDLSKWLGINDDSENTASAVKRYGSYIGSKNVSSSVRDILMGKLGDLPPGDLAQLGTYNKIDDYISGVYAKNLGPKGATDPTREMILNRARNYSIDNPPPSVDAQRSDVFFDRLNRDFNSFLSIFMGSQGKGDTTKIFIPGTD